MPPRAFQYLMVMKIVEGPVNKTGQTKMPGSVESASATLSYMVRFLSTSLILFALKALAKHSGQNILESAWISQRRQTKRPHRSHGLAARFCGWKKQAASVSD